MTFEDIDRLAEHALMTDPRAERKEWTLYLHPDHFTALVDSVPMVAAQTGVPPGEAVYNSACGLRVRLVSVA